MCPCPFCCSIAILLSPLLLFKGPRQWLKNKLKRHHKNCSTCQSAEHHHCHTSHIQCTCEKCKRKRK